MSNYQPKVPPYNAIVLLSLSNTKPSLQYLKGMLITSLNSWNRENKDLWLQTKQIVPRCVLASVAEKEDDFLSCYVLSLTSFARCFKNQQLSRYFSVICHKTCKMHERNSLITRLTVDFSEEEWESAYLQSQDSVSALNSSKHSGGASIIEPVSYVLHPEWSTKQSSCVSTGAQNKE